MGQSRRDHRAIACIDPQAVCPPTQLHLARKADEHLRVPVDMRAELAAVNPLVRQRPRQREAHAPPRTRQHVLQKAHMLARFLVREVAAV